MSILQKIKTALLGDKTPGSEENTQPVTPNSMADGLGVARADINIREKAAEEIVRRMRQHQGSKSAALQVLTVHIDTSGMDAGLVLNDTAWADDEFVDRLRLMLDNAGLSNVGVKGISVTSGSGMNVQDMIRVSGRLYIRCSGEARKETARQQQPVDADVVAVVTVVEGTGSLLLPSYTLDPNVKRTFRIGRGQTSHAGGFHSNDIVVREDETDARLREHNCRVSRRHAAIVWENGAFRLRAYEGGCRNTGGNATKILREDVDELELYDTLTPHTLYDGDLIELGKHVVLRYSVVPRNT